MLVVDSSVWIDYFNGVVSPQTDTLHQVLLQEPVLVGDLILAEVLQGFRSDHDYALAQEALLKLETVTMTSVELALKSAENYRFLRKKGITVRKTIDALIASYCIENNLELLHNDADYDAFEQHLGLKVVSSK